MVLINFHFKLFNHKVDDMKWKKLNETIYLKNNANFKSGNTKYCIGNMISSDELYNITCTPVSPFHANLILLHLRSYVKIYQSSVTRI